MYNTGAWQDQSQRVGSRQESRILGDNDLRMWNGNCSLYQPLIMLEKECLKGLRVEGCGGMGME